MREILADLVAEQQSLDQSLQRSPDRDWKKRVDGTPTTVQDTIAILAWEEQHAAKALTGEASVLDEVEEYADFADHLRQAVAEGNGKRPQEVIEWWRFARADVVSALYLNKPDDRVPWVGGDVSARTFATLRLAETWARGLGILTTLDKEIVDTPRLRHIAWLGWATLPYAFDLAGDEYDDPIRVEVTGPAYARWVFGPDDASDVVRGAAGDWCRLVVGRPVPAKSSSLKATGPVAERALEVAGIFQ
jgi:uncharacterized protein (TIGR03084 family)